MKKFLHTISVFFLSYRGLLFILTIWVFLFMAAKHEKRWNNITIIAHDVSGYYAYLPATFTQHDLFFENYHDSLSKNNVSQYMPELTLGGKRFIRYTMGMSYAYAPFFFAANIIARSTGEPANGYSKPYQYMILFSGWFYLLFGLIYLRKFLKFYFSEQTALLTLFLTVFASNLFYYASSEGAMPHTFDFVLYAALLYYSAAFAREKKTGYFVGILITASWLTLIRPVNGVCMLIPIFMSVTGSAQTGEKFKWIFSSWKTVLLLCIIPALFLLPQLLYWKASTGHWFYYSYKHEGFDFTKPEIMNGLFSYRKGWLVYSPLWLLILPGIFFLWRKNKNLSIFISVFLLLYVYIIFSWWSWWYGGSFGCRAIIDIYAFTALPLAAFIDWSTRIKWFYKIPVAAALVFVMLLNLFQTNQYKACIIHWDRMDKKTYWMVWGKEGLTPEEVVTINKIWDSNYKENYE